MSFAFFFSFFLREKKEEQVPSLKRKKIPFTFYSVKKQSKFFFFKGNERGELSYFFSFGKRINIFLKRKKIPFTFNSVKKQSNKIFFKQNERGELSFFFFGKRINHFFFSLEKNEEDSE
jgi:hypothetical protein